MIIFPGALGDLLLALPTLRALRSRHRGARCTIAVSEPLRALVARTDVADVTVSLDAAEAAGLGGGERLPTWLDGCPHVYSWFGVRSPAVRARIAGAAATACFASVERDPDGTHAALAYAAAVGVPVSPRRLRLAAQIDPGPSPRADALYSRLAPPVLIVHPGAGGRAKRWDAAGFAGVAAWWVRRGGDVVALAGPAEDGSESLPGAHEVRAWPLVDVAAALARAACYLGNDSGVSHLAGAVGVPGVVLFGPTAPGRWRPSSTRLTALRAASWTPDGIPLAALAVRRVVAACRRRFTLTRGDLDTSVHASSLAGRLARRIK